MKLRACAGLLRMALSISVLAVLAPARAAPVEESRPSAVRGERRPEQPRNVPDSAPPHRLFDTRQLEGGGTIVLEDIMRLVRQSPRLASEVRAALRTLGQTPKHIVCIGKHLDGRWRYLAGARVEPYVCRFGERWLEIRADLRLQGRRGESYVTASEVTRKNARQIRETNPRWTWTEAKPSEWVLD